MVSRACGNAFNLIENYSNLALPLHSARPYRRFGLHFGGDWERPSSTQLAAGRVYVRYEFDICLRCSYGICQF